MSVFANVCSLLTLKFLTSTFDFLGGVLFETVALRVHLQIQFCEFQQLCPFLLLIET